MPIRSGGQAPYAPSETVIRLIRAYRDRSLPTPFTKEVLIRAGVPESLVQRTLQTFKLLDLIDEAGNPTAEFEGLRRVGDAEFPERLAAIVRAVYAEIFQFIDPAKESLDRIRDQFRAYEPLGQLQRMMALFIGLCEEAGIVPQGTLRRPPTPNAGSPSRPATPRQPKRTTTSSSFKGPAGTRVSSGQIHAADGAIPEGLVAILAMLPKNGAGWPKARRDQFVQLFGSALDFAIPVREVEPQGPADSDEDQD